MQANHALHAYKPLLPAVKTGHPHGFVIFLLAKIHIISNLAKTHN
nr:MAG TPA: hypothetical protein [Caudoviricetes sp.]